MGHRIFFCMTVMFMVVWGKLMAQDVQDTVVLKSVEIVGFTADRLFEKEEAGMRETKVDSIVMMEKISSSLSDLLSENTPIFIKNNGRGALATASFRGTAASHTQVVWNGININSPMTGSVDFSLIPVYIIDDINLKHGTASIADNSGGLGGSINIGNYDTHDTCFTLKYVQGIGSYHTFNEYLGVGWGNRKISLKTRVYHNYSKNDFTFVNRRIKVYNPVTGLYEYPIDTNDNASYKIYGLLQEIYFHINGNNALSVKYWGQRADRSIPQVTSYEGPENSNLNNQKDDDNKVVVDWTHYGLKSELVVRSGFSNKHLLYTLRNFVSGVGIIPAIYSVSMSNSFVNSAKYTYNFSEDFSIEASFDANFHKVSSTDTIQHVGYDAVRQEYSAFMSINKSFWKRLNMTLMMREDLVDGKFAPLIPYLGFDLKILKKADFIVKGNIARNYHQPTLNDLYWIPGGNRDLLPENGFGFELGLEYQYVVPDFKIKTEVTGFRNDVNNWIVWIPSFKGYWQPMNISRVLAQGIEASLSAEKSIKNVYIRVSGNYAYNHARNYGDIDVWGEDSYGKQLVYIPLHSANALVNVTYRKFFVTYQFNYYSERYTTSTNDITRRDWLYPYFMSDVFVGKDFNFKNFDFSVELKIYNLLNESYHSVLYRPMPGRNFLLQLVFEI